MRVGNVRINLCGGNIGVSEKLLNTAHVGAILYQMRGKRMSKRMRRNVFQPDFFGIFFDKQKNRLAIYRFPQTAHKDIAYLYIFFFAPDN